MLFGLGVLLNERLSHWKKEVEHLKSYHMLQDLTPILHFDFEVLMWALGEPGESNRVITLSAERHLHAIVDGFITFKTDCMRDYTHLGKDGK